MQVRAIPLPKAIREISDLRAEVAEARELVKLLSNEPAITDLESYAFELEALVARASSWLKQVQMLDPVQKPDIDRTRLH